VNIEAMINIQAFGSNQRIDFRATLR